EQTFFIRQTVSISAQFSHNTSPRLKVDFSRGLSLRAFRALTESFGKTSGSPRRSACRANSDSCPSSNSSATDSAATFAANALCLFSARIACFCFLLGMALLDGTCENDCLLIAVNRSDPPIPLRFFRQH